MKTCCFIGHRDAKLTKYEALCLDKLVEMLITEGFEIFLFGSKSKFTDYCYGVVTHYMYDHRNIRRVYVRAEKRYLTREEEKLYKVMYEETFFPPQLENAHQYVYVERDLLMVKNSDVCVFYFDEMRTGKSGTRAAYALALVEHKQIENIFGAESLTDD